MPAIDAESTITTSDRKVDPLDPRRFTVESWSKALKSSWDFKEDEFQKDADDCWNFYAGNRKSHWDRDSATGARGYMNDSGVASPSYGFVNLTIAEGVQLFAPTVYNTNPTVNVIPKQFLQLEPQEMGFQFDPNSPFDPQRMKYEEMVGRHSSESAMKAAAGKVMEEIINYFMRETRAYRHNRLSVDDAFVNGLGCSYCALDWMPHDEEHPLVGNFFDSSRNFLQDRDAEQDDQVFWQAQMCCEPIWDIAEKYGCDEDDLRRYCDAESSTSHAFRSAIGDEWLKQRGQTKDLLVYWKIWSKMGMGDKFRENVGSRWDGTGKALRRFGKYCYLVIAPSVPYPLNLPDKVWDKGLDSDEVFDAVQWPIPFYEDGMFPCSKLQYVTMPGKLWPKSHFFKGLPHMKADNWIMSFLMAKVQASCGTIIVFPAGLDEKAKSALLSGRDNISVELPEEMYKRMYGKGKAGSPFQFIQADQFHQDLYRVRAENKLDMEKTLGLPDILYGVARTQSRSAEDVRSRNENAGGRVGDFRTLTDEWSCELVKKMAIAISTLMDPDDVYPIVGPMGTYIFERVIKRMSVQQICREYIWDIVPGSTVRRSKQVELEDSMEMLQAGGAVWGQLALGGMPQPLNAILRDIASARGIPKEKWQEYMVPPPPPPEEQPPDPKLLQIQAKAEVDQQKALLDAQKAQVDQQLKVEEHQANLAVKVAELDIKRQEAVLNAQVEQQRMMHEAAKAAVDIEATQAKAQTEAAIDVQKAQLDAGLQVQKARTQERVQTAQAASQLAIGEVQAAQQSQQSQAEHQQTMKQNAAQAKAKAAESKATARKSARKKK